MATRTARKPAAPPPAEPAPPPAAPTPAAFLAEWWPASVRIPGGKSYAKAKVYLTRQGLYVYAKPDAAPDFHVAIDYGKTRKPATEYAARVNGIRLVTTDGAVIVVRKLSGCGCRHPLKEFRPPLGGPQ